MLDQSFSAENFRKIFDLENRKGNYLEGQFFSNLKSITEKLTDLRKELKKEKNHREDLNIKIDELKNDKEAKLQEELHQVSKKILAPEFKIKLTQKVISGKKPIYTVQNSPEYYFAIKQLQHNISRLFKVKQSNRFDIISQVISLLNDDFPKFVLRTDINDFYESIPHVPLLKRVYENNLLSPFSKKLLKQILSEYKEQSSSSAKGIPRGIGVSAYLAELYMQMVDKRVMALEDLCYYARYVDDILIIFVPSPIDLKKDYLKEIERIIQVDFGLKLNTAKTKELDLRETRGETKKMIYLGYEISFGNGGCKAKLSDKKITKYKDRIELIFKKYHDAANHHEKKARKLLIKRLRFLTGNTRLKNNKSNILVGIYYSNVHLTDCSDLKKLDKFLGQEINKIPSIPAKKRLNEFSFVKGFETKKFSPFTTNDLKQIVKAWK